MKTTPRVFTPDGAGGWIFSKETLSSLSRDDQISWINDEMERCKHDPFYFATTYTYSTNEHLDDLTGLPPEDQLMPDWPHVRAFFEAWATPQDVIVEKSRDMMLSWLVMAGVLHDLLFRTNWNIMTLSRVEKLVDDGGESSTVDSLHGKIRHMYNRLPSFFRKTCKLTFKYLQIRNDDANTHCTGFSATPSAGRGPKWRRAVLDEFAWVPWSEQVMASVARACPNGKYLVSTPHGKANAFYRVREASQEIWPNTGPEVKHWKRLAFHWSHHPFRDQAWYDAQCDSQSMTLEAIAQELDISYTRSVGRRVYPSFVHEDHVSGGRWHPLKMTDYRPNAPIYLTCDFNYDPLVWVIVQLYSEAPRIRVIGEICRRNAVLDDAIQEFIFRFGRKSWVDHQIKQHPSWAGLYGNNGICVAGPDGHQSQVILHGDATEEKNTHRSRVKTYAHIVAELRAAGMEVVRKIPKTNPPIKHRLELVNDGLRHRHILMSPQAEQLRKDFEEGTWNNQGSDMIQNKEDDDGSGLTRSHASSAFGYLVCKIHKASTAEPEMKARAGERYGLKDMLGDHAKAWTGVAG